ncbi:hypothetical protein [Spiribacter sp. 2438]|nr:hypothetical protein [Spiribacter sp. 2438]
MSTAEYLAIAAGLVVVWQGADAVIAMLSLREERLLWTFSLPL